MKYFLFDPVIIRFCNEHYLERWAGAYWALSFGPSNFAILKSGPRNYFPQVHSQPNVRLSNSFGILHFLTFAKI